MSTPEEPPRVAFENGEKGYLRKQATFSADTHYAQRIHGESYEPDAIRAEFHRDYTRIIHSQAFRRLRHKTQVFISPKNDHLCTRLEHSLHVASVAQTIARALRLNEDLVRAIAVGHDLGHAPFGHIGERSLNSIASEHGLAFSHELHSLRVVDVLESPYQTHNGLNLTFAVRDGIVCHHGEGFEPKLTPDRTKNPEDLQNTIQGASRPATLEGCVVRWADKVAYLGRDLEDALNPEVKLVTTDGIPESVRTTLGISNREIIARLVTELVRTHKDDAISVGKEVHTALNDLYAFNMEHIYKSEQGTKQRDQIEKSMKFLFETLLEQLKNVKGDIDLFSQNGSPRVLSVFAEFLRHDIRDLAKHAEEQLVIDYIAGMTDPFFTESCKELFLPDSTV